MAARNDVTGDSLVSKSSNEKYRSEWDRIFGKKKETKEKKKDG
jgi:hypothetical protein